MTPRTVPIICGKRPVRSGPVPAVRQGQWHYGHRDRLAAAQWRCSFCGARVKVAW